MQVMPQARGTRTKVHERYRTESHTRNSLIELIAEILTTLGIEIRLERYEY